MNAKHHQTLFFTITDLDLAEEVYRNAELRRQNKEEAERAKRLLIRRIIRRERKLHPHEGQ